MPADTPTEGGQRPHPVADLDTIVIDPDDVVEMLRRNDRDETEQRTHVLRVRPPFEGEKRATPHVSEDHARYPPEMSPTPLHIGERTFFESPPGGLPNWVPFPSLAESRSRFRSEFDLDADEEPSEHPEWDEWWTAEVEMWESVVRAHLPDEITLRSRNPEVASTTVNVSYQNDDDE